MLSIACWVCYNCFKHLRVAFGSERLLFVPKTDHHHPKNNNNKAFFSSSVFGIFVTLACFRSTKTNLSDSQR